MATLLLLALAAACDAEPTNPAASDPSASSGMPTATAPPDLPSVSTVVRAVEARDAAALAGLVRYTVVPCIPTPQGVGAPPLCAAFGVPAGSIVEALPALLCEGEYLSRSAVLLLLQQQLEHGGLVPHGVLGVDAAPYTFPPGFPAVRGWLVPKHAAVFRSTTGGLDLGFYIDGDHIVALRSFGSCGPLLPPPGDPAWQVPPRP